MKSIKRGDIIYVNLAPRRIGQGHVQSGMRPCVVLSNDKSNQYSGILCVCPFSGKLKNNPVHVIVSPSDVKGYLEKESDFLAEQIVTIDQRWVMSKVGHIPEDSEIMEKINHALSLQLGLLDFLKEV